MVDSRDRTMSRKVFGLAQTLVLVLVLSACSVGGDDDDEPPATEASGQVAETSQPVQQNAGTSQPPTMAGDSIAASPDTTSAGTPAAGGSPTPRIVVSAPPIAMPTATPTSQPAESTPSVEAATPQAVIPSNATVGDGTGGAVAAGSGASPQPEVPEAGSPAASPASEVALAAGCNAGDFPLYAGSAAMQLTTTDVNFRAGPGQDCDVIGEPVAAGVTVEMLSDPVQRSGDAEFEWVLVSIDGTQGWLATELLEPVSG